MDTYLISWKTFARLAVGDIKQLVRTGRLCWEKYLWRTSG